MTDALERWRQGWRGTDLIAGLNRPGGGPAAETIEVIQKAGRQLVNGSIRDEQGQITELAASAEVLMVSGPGLDAEAFAALRRARFVLRPYVGYDDIDVDAATEQGILVANVPDTFVEEVANHTLALLLSWNRRLIQMDGFVREGLWFARQNPREVAHPIRRLSTMTLGIIGFGGIGRLVAARARPFGFRMLAADPFVSAETTAEHGVTLAPMDDLLRESDIVTLHTFLNRDTRGFINERCFSLMKRTAILVNTSRGPVVDEAALIKALESGQIAGAALDVMEVEPLDPGSPLTRMQNVILEPHLASYSDEGDHLHRLRCGDLVVQAATGGLPERKVVINKDLYDRIAALPELAGVKRF